MGIFPALCIARKCERLTPHSRAPARASSNNGDVVFCDNGFSATGATVVAEFAVLLMDMALFFRFAPGISRPAAWQAA